MLEENIRKLLDSDVEADNQLGWELIEAKNIPYKDVLEYVRQAKTATRWEDKYLWDGTKFKKNPRLSKIDGPFWDNNTSIGEAIFTYPQSTTSV